MVPDSSSSRVEALNAFGISNASVVAEMESSLGFQLTLDSEAIAARAVEMSRLFYPAHIPIPDAYYELSPQHQEALKLVGRAAQLLEVPFRLQSNAFGDVFEQLIMETPAYAPLRSFYQRFGGPYDFLRSDEQKRNHGFLPGMEETTRPSGGGMYPVSFKSLADFRRFVPEGSELDKEMRVVFRLEGDQLVATPYSQAFSRWLEPAAALLEGAAALFDVDRPAMAEGLRKTAQSFRTNDYYDRDTHWAGQNDPQIDLNIGAVEQYLDKLRGRMAQFMGYIQIKNPKQEMELAPLRDAFPILEEKLPVPEDYKKPLDQRIPRPVSVVDTLLATADANGGDGVAVAHNQPNDEMVRKKTGYRIVIMDNRMNARNIIPPAQRRVTERLIHPSQRHLVTARGLKLFVFFHEEAHGNGIEFVRDKPDLKAIQALEDIGKTFEELRADINGLYNTKTALNLGLISTLDFHEIYVSFIHRCLGLLRKGTSEAHARGALVALNYFTEIGAITTHPETGETEVHIDKMYEASADFTRELMIIKGDGNRKEADRLFEQYGTLIPTVLTSVYEEMSDLPLDIIITYEFAKMISGPSS